MAQAVVLAAGEHEEGDLGDPDDAVDDAKARARSPKASGTQSETISRAAIAPNIDQAHGALLGSMTLVSHE